MFPHFYLPEDAKTGTIKLYKDEDEVWESLKKINDSGKDLSPDIHRAFKEIVDKILSNKDKQEYHPLDFPIVRYFLHPNWVESNLPFVQHPDFIKNIRHLFGDAKTQQFFQEIEAERPDQFYIRIHSLRAVWECAKFLDDRSAKIIEFHQQIENKSRSGISQGPDIVFEWSGKKWCGEVKHLCHININLFCIAQALAGIMHLRNEGEKLRKWNSILIEGENINDVFRKKTIKSIHEGLSYIFDGLKSAKSHIPKVEKTIDDLDVEAVQARKHKIIIEIRPKLQETTSRKVTLILQRWPRPDSIQNYYTISPSKAYWWPKPFTPEFYNKLDEDITKIAQKKGQFADRYLGFLHLDLHEQNIDQRKKEGEKQQWEQEVEQRLNQEPFPLVFVTDSTRLQKSLYIMNNAAYELSFL